MTYKEIIFESLLDLQKPRRSSLKKRESKRIAFPKARLEESSDDNVPSKKTQQKKRQKQLRTASKNAVYSEILEKHLHHAHKSTKAGPSDRIHRAQSVPKRLRQESVSSSDEDDSLCSTTELRQAQAEARAWKTKTRRLEEDQKFLKEQVSSLQRCLESKIFKGKNILEVQLCFKCSNEKLLCQLPELCDPGVLQKSALPAACPSTAAAEMNPFQQPTYTDTVLSQGPPPGACQVSTGPAFHLAKGIVISSGQAAKIFRGKKPTIIGKETAKAIWTNAVLATRSVTGTTCPQKRAAGEPAKPPLTPEKIDIVQAAISFWGDQNKQSAAAAAVVGDIGNLLREKCQDARRSEERSMKKKL
ncbi:unnamed protein product [Ixodes pacificus]